MKKRSVHESIVTMISVFMALVYMGGGIFLISSSLSFGFLRAGAPERYVLAGVLILYGIYRGYRAWTFYHSDRSDNA